MPIQVRNVLPHTISGTELSRVRTEPDQLRILPSSSPHPVQAIPQPAPHGYFRNVPLPTHGQVSIATSPVRITTYRRLCCLYQQEAQQRIRSEEHTSELQSLRHLVCRLLLEKKK